MLNRDILIFPVFSDESTLIISTLTAVVTAQRTNLPM